MNIVSLNMKEMSKRCAWGGGVGGGIKNICDRFKSSNLNSGLQTLMPRIYFWCQSVNRRYYVI